jgi:predicted phage terminase large subunit-like protein
MDAAGFEKVLATLNPVDLERLHASIERQGTADLDTRRAKLVATAKDDLIAYTKFTMPNLKARHDPLASRYQAARHHRALGAAFQKVDTGEWPLLIVTMPPRHGKSELAAKHGPAWFLGRDPYRQVIFATYNEDLAGDTGREIRDIIRSPQHRLVFPDCELARGSQSVDRLKTTWGGALMCVGRGGSITGRGADLAIIDDPIKGREEADSKSTRDKLWGWFNDDVYSRLLDEGGRVVIIQTRWHEDDLVGRLTDPGNPHYTVEEARKWRILDLPALARDNDPIGRAEGDALWPERFSAEYLKGVRNRNPRGFASLYQCRPTPDDGDFFRSDWLKTYKSESELPKGLRWFAASDHAVATRQENDRTCLMIGGVDEDGVLWIPPSVEWGRFATDITVDKMLALMKRHNPQTWWAEDEHISKSIGPFLRKRMRDEQTYVTIETVSAAKDKSTRAQSARGMLSLGLVRFPSFAPWWEDAKAELLKFPNATHDDFVDAFAHLAFGVDRMFGSRRAKKEEPTEERRTFGWLKALSKAADRAHRVSVSGW